MAKSFWVRGQEYVEILVGELWGEPHDFEGAVGLLFLFEDLFAGLPFLAFFIV